jgi:tetratricopeptide (TPR) repeat protein
MSTIEESSKKSGVVKKTSAIIGIIAGLIAATLGIWQMINYIRESRETREKVRIHISAGDSFNANEKYDQAMEQYKKALEADNDNIEAHLRIIRASRDHLLKITFYRKNLDVALSDYGLIGNWQFPEYKLAPQSKIDEALSRIYELQGRFPSLKENVELLLDEALILKAGKEPEQSMNVLLKASKLSPDHPEVLAELGLMSAYNSYVSQYNKYVSKSETDGIQLIRRAIDLRDSNARYHYYLARSLERIDHAAEAIRSYRKAYQLATGKDTWSKQIRHKAPYKSFYLLYNPLRFASKNFSDIDMSSDECLKEMEYLLTTEADFSKDNLYYRDKIIRIRDACRSLD